MTALQYLFFTKLKNRIKNFFRKPAQIVYLVLMAAFAGFLFFTGGKGTEASPGNDPQGLSAIFTAYFTMMFVLIAKNGFGRGGSIFSLPDVNLIFTAPFKSSRVLFFGLFNQLGTSLMLGLLLIAQYSWMNQFYGVSARDIAALILGYAAVLFAANLFAMLVYSFTSGRETLRKTLKFVFYGILAAYILVVLASALSGTDSGRPDPGSILPRIAAAMNTPLAKFFPVTGWFGGIFLDLYTGSSSFLWIGAALFALYFSGSVCAVVFFKHDYYEDVLQTAEYNFSAIAARKEGRSPEAVPANVKVGKTGIGKGEGSSAFYYKHRVENRRAKKLLLSPFETVSVLVTLAFGYFMRDAGDSPMLGIWMALGFGTYLQIFTAALGRFTKELSKPYIYLVPEHPFKKLFHAVRDGFPGMLAEAVLIFIPLGLLLKLNPLLILTSVLTRVSFSALLLALNILSQRIFGEGRAVAFTMIFYILLLIAMAAPGVALAVLAGVLGWFLGVSAAFASVLLLTLANLAVSVLVIFLSRNMLQNAEWGR